jgi:hypothetical protein
MGCLRVIPRVLEQLCHFHYSWHLCIPPPNNVTMGVQETKPYRSRALETPLRSASSPTSISGLLFRPNLSTMMARNSPSNCLRKCGVALPCSPSDDSRWMDILVAVKIGFSLYGPWATAPHQILNTVYKYQSVLSFPFFLVSFVL